MRLAERQLIMVVVVWSRVFRPWEYREKELFVRAGWTTNLKFSSGRLEMHTREANKGPQSSVPEIIVPGI